MKYKTKERFTLTQAKVKQMLASPPTHYFENDSILTLKFTPFKDSVKINSNPSIYLEQNDVTLQWVINRRLGTERMLMQEEINNLIETCVYGMAFLQRKNLCLKDVHPSNIFWYRNKRKWKICNPQLLSEGYKSIKQKFYPLAPEQIVSLRQGVTPNQQRKSDMFSLGMVLLQACSLTSMQAFYDENDYSIVQPRVIQALKIVEKFYSQFTVKVLTLLLNYDADSRMTPLEMSMLLNHQLNVKPLLEGKTPSSTAVSHPSVHSQISFNPNPRVKAADPLPENRFQTKIKQPTTNPYSQTINTNLMRPFELIKSELTTSQLFLHESKPSPNLPFTRQISLPVQSPPREIQRFKPQERSLPFQPFPREFQRMKPQERSQPFQPFPREFQRMGLQERSVPSPQGNLQLQIQRMKQQLQITKKYIQGSRR